MLKVGITGNIGTGKTTVCRVFESLGIAVYYADREAKKFYRDPSVKDAVQKLFGKNIFDIDGELKRAELAGVVFNNPDKLKQLNAIIHPLVLEDLLKWADNHLERDYILYESALLFESGFYKHFDKSILVTAPLKLAKRRVLERDHISEEDFLARAANQLHESEKISIADFMLDNNEKTPLIPRVIEIHHSLCN